MKKILYILVFLFVFSVGSYAQNTIDLSGKWTVQLDIKRQGIKKDGNWLPISLPGSLTEAKIGKKTSGSDFGVLTQTYKYLGVAWYQKEIEIPKSWKK